jgi:uncharacterized protein involved in exopolysaccharide biosynthesis
MSAAPALSTSTSNLVLVLVLVMVLAGFLACYAPKAQFSSKLGATPRDSDRHDE